jgi:ABC-type branched-subunit amino acid transport system ATPase component
MTDAPALLEASGVELADGAGRAVQAASLSVAAGGVVALLGGPEAGKSALLEALAGVRPVRRGEIRLGGRDVTALGPDRRLALGLALARQQPDLFPGLTVDEHLRLGAVPTRSRIALARTRALRAVPELVARTAIQAEALGHADQRLLDIARALMAAPALLLLDEPSLVLDADRVGRLVEALRADGTAVLLAERFPRPALDLADHAILVLGGRIVAAGAPEELRRDERLAPACTGELMPD